MPKRITHTQVCTLVCAVIDVLPTEDLRERIRNADQASRDDNDKESTRVRMIADAFYNAAWSNEYEEGFK